MKEKYQGKASKKKITSGILRLFSSSTVVVIIVIVVTLVSNKLRIKKTHTQIGSRF